MTRCRPQSGPLSQRFPAIKALSLATCLLLSPAAFAGNDLSAEAVNDSGINDRIENGNDRAAVLRAQILLDRARFSPGEIDGVYGSNTRRAIRAFQRSHDIDDSGSVDEKTWAALNAGGAEALVRHTLTGEDVAGPFRSIPSGMEAQSKLDALPYSSVEEALGERFHLSPALLEKLNPDKSLEAGVEILVPNIATAKLDAPDRVIVDESDGALTLVNAEGKVYAYFPATTGSENDPLPIGEWDIQGVAMDPTFHYNPELFWDSDPSDEKAKIPAGPNNPVGVVWIDLSKEHYGIHGTPAPSNIGKTQSHGCIRLTNWSARAVAEAVSPGTKAVLQK